MSQQQLIPLTEEQRKEVQERVEALNKELTPLLAKFELNLASIPFIQNGLIAAQVTVIDTKYSPKAEQPAAEAKPAQGLTEA